MRYALATLALALAALIALATFAPSTALAAPKGCFRTTFQTKLIKGACKKGGQPAAKKTMQKFVKDAKKKEAGLECKGCHKALAPEYPLKDDALDHFHKLGGK